MCASEDRFQVQRPDRLTCSRSAAQAERVDRVWLAENGSERHVPSASGARRYGGKRMRPKAAFARFQRASPCRPVSPAKSRSGRIAPTARGHRSRVAGPEPKVSAINLHAAGAVVSGSGHPYDSLSNLAEEIMIPYRVVRSAGLSIPDIKKQQIDIGCVVELPAPQLAQRYYGHLGFYRTTAFIPSERRSLQFRLFRERQIQEMLKNHVRET